VSFEIAASGSCIVLSSMLTSIPSAAVFAKSGVGHQARNGPIFGSGSRTMAMIVQSGV